VIGGPCISAEEMLCISIIVMSSSQNIHILLLLDLGSTHSFVSEQVTSLLQGVTTARTPSKVKVANGETLYFDAQILNVEWFIHGYSFTLDLRVLPLQNFDMIVGMDYLELFSPTKIHLAKKWLTIIYQGKQVTFQGIVPGVVDCHMIELMQLALQMQTVCLLRFLLKCMQCWSSSSLSLPLPLNCLLEGLVITPFHSS
jgi:hypothetical protein